MIFLTQGLDAAGMRLLDSLHRAGYGPHAVDLRYDGFLPDEVGSPFAFYTGSMASAREGVPLYFDRLSLPRRWEIRGNHRSGGIYDYEQLRGRIFFAEPTHLRYIRAVHWLDMQGHARCHDHYDRFGYRFAQTVLDAGQRPVLRTYYDGAGREVILEHLVTGDILLRRDGREHRFASRLHFLYFFLQEMGWDMDRILYNSLDGPFAFSEMLGRRGEKGEDILFWQEGPREDVPGNMAHILAGGSPRTKKILVQNRQAYQALQAALDRGQKEAAKEGAEKNSKPAEGAPEKAQKEKASPLGSPGAGGQRAAQDLDRQMLAPLGYICEAGEPPAGGRQALVLTNTDQVEHLAELARGLPSFTFHVAARTEMSARLLSMDRFANVKLYPCVEMPVLARLQQDCDYYLDINRGEEILEGVQAAFLRPQLIAGFAHTLCHRELVAPACIFEPGDAAGMCRFLQDTAEDPGSFARAIRQQRQQGMAEDPASYRRAIGSHATG